MIPQSIPTNRVGLLLAVIIIAGCESRPTKMTASPAPTVPVQPVEPIAPGDRSEWIDGARFYSVSEYLKLPEDQLPKTGDRVCLEGIVRGSGYIMGPPFVNLTTAADAGKGVICEGAFDWDVIRFDVGTNVVVVGKQMGSGLGLVETTVVKQSQIDHALEQERNPVHEKTQGSESLGF